jgi:hypothetical protein
MPHFAIGPRFAQYPQADLLHCACSLLATNSALISVRPSPIHWQEIDVKSFVLAAALLLPTMALAQDAAPPAATAPPAPAAAARPKRAPAPAVARVAPKPAQTSTEVMDVNQIIGIRQVDPATYEIDARLQNGTEIHLRMNAFVMQGLGMQLGTYGKAPGG